MVLPRPRGPKPLTCGISSGSESEHSVAPATLLLEHSHYTSSRTLPLERSLQADDPPDSILVSTQFPFCSCHPIKPRPGVRNGMRTLGNGSGLFQPRHGILTAGQSSVLPEVLLRWKLCSLMLRSLSAWKTVREQRIIRPRDRKQTKLTLLSFYQCGGSDHDFCTHSTNVTHRDKRKARHVNNYVAQKSSSSPLRLEQFPNAKTDDHRCHRHE